MYRSITQNKEIVSTHSLTRRLTLIRKLSIFEMHRRFNSQPHEEADVTIAHVYLLFNMFQLTASRGG